MAPNTFIACVSLAFAGIPLGAAAQAPAPQVVLPDVIVTAQKEPAKAQTLPLSITAITADMLARAGVAIVSDAAVTVPNTVFTEFTARKLSNARFRGVGSSPANPAVTTFFDGVPQLNANASSIELVDVDQVEFVRGPQSALHGRNTLGGLVNVTSARPSLSAWTGRLVAPLGNFGARDVKASISGPLAPTVGMSLAIGHGEREGFTTNSVTGRTVDDRSATFGKAQLLWTPAAQWDTRLIVSGERSRDGDYALGDLAGIRANPFTVARDFEGRQDRDVASATLQARREGARISVTSTSGFVRWKAQDVTDLDYSPMSFITRDNTEEARQFSQEVRLASAAAAPFRLSDSATLAWQAGVFGFTEVYEQDAINTFSPFILSQFLPFSINQHSPKGTIDDLGFAAFGHATMTVN
ncbi:MAG: TonB-dependent receptor plug domain-containing protein, partial [Acidobacteria bacterium]|nr:TonB-dependent receptor plug domain-containing protein [Acidobacteriota bacterium]